MYALDYSFVTFFNIKSLSWLEKFKSNYLNVPHYRSNDLFINTKLGDTSTDTKTVINEWTLLKNEIEKIIPRNKKFKNAKKIWIY